MTVEMDGTQMDVIDIIISTLREHEKALDLASERVVKSAEILEQVIKHSLDGEKLNKIEELVVFSQAQDNPSEEILEVYGKILNEIKK